VSDQARDALAEVLAAHADVRRVAEPRNNADRNLGRIRYAMRCTCGREIPWPDDEAAHRLHLADALAAHVRAERAGALREAAANSVAGTEGGVAAWLRDRADQIERGE
jgi:hypothetical protein